MESTRQNLHNRVGNAEDLRRNQHIQRSHQAFQVTPPMFRYYLYDLKSKLCLPSNFCQLGGAEGTHKGRDYALRYGRFEGTQQGKRLYL